MAANKKKAARKRTASKRTAPKRVVGLEDKLYTRQVRNLVRLMVDNDLTSLEIVNGDLKVALGRGVPVVVPEGAAIGTTAGPSAPAPVAAAIEPEPQAREAEALTDVTSPMVGTFYAAPSPDSEPFVTVGTHVTPDTVVCIVEAMKVMNEIKAECSGTIVELVATNGQPVEYGQVLYRVKP